MTGLIGLALEAVQCRKDEQWPVHSKGVEAENERFQTELEGICR
jgi:hypothetical protein